MDTRPYDPRMYAYETTPGHYWARTADEAGVPIAGTALDRDLKTDVAIIGGGYTGLFAAYRLVADHQLSALVLEAGTCPGWGASGRNAGFVAAGGNKLSLSQMTRRFGQAATAHYHHSQAEAVTSLRAIIERHNIDCDAVSDENICVAHDRAAARELAEEADVLSGVFRSDARYLTGAAFRSAYHDGPETFGALVTRPAFAIHPTKLVRGLARVASEAGAAIHTGAEVTGWRREGGRHILTTLTGAKIEAARVILATNGYMPNALDPRLGFRTIPAISSIIITQAYDPHELARRGYHSIAPIYTARHLLAYYRLLPDGRLLFGCRGDTVGSRSEAGRHAARTLIELKRTLPAFHDARIDDHWNGFVSLTARRTLALGHAPDDPSTVFAFGCHGSGIATMTWAGRVAADICVKPKTMADVPLVFRGLPPRLPPAAALLRWGLRAAYGYYVAEEKLHGVLSRISGARGGKSG